MTNTMQSATEQRGGSLGKGASPMDGMILNQRWLVEDRLDRYRAEARADRLVAAASDRDDPVPQLGATSSVSAARAADVHAFRPSAHPAPAGAASVEGGQRAAGDCRCPEGVAAA